MTNPISALNLSRPLGALGGLLLLVLVAGCGSSATSPERDLAELQDWFRRKLPAGWQVGTAQQAGFPVLPPTQPADLVLWKTEPVPLQWRTEPVATQLVAHVYFSLAKVNWIEPTEFAALYKQNQALLKKHEYYRARLANLPRDPAGNYLPRGAAEQVVLAEVLKESADLPPARADLPTHYFGQLALQIHDWRTVLVPADRETQQEQNRVYALFNEIMKRYPTR